MKRYRRLMYGFVGLAVLGFVAGMRLDYPLVAVGVYWAGALASVAVWQGTSVSLFDERERSMQRWAADVTLHVFAFVLIVGSPGQIVIEELGYAVPAWFEGAMYGYAALFGVLAVVYGVRRYLL